MDIDLINQMSETIHLLGAPKNVVEAIRNYEDDKSIEICEIFRTYNFSLVEKIKGILDNQSTIKVKSGINKLN